MPVVSRGKAGEGSAAGGATSDAVENLAPMLGADQMERMKEEMLWLIESLHKNGLEDTLKGKLQFPPEFGGFYGCARRM